MSIEQFSNGVSTTLNGSINNSVTSLTVTSAGGFPSSGNFRIIIDSEILLVTAVSGTTFTVTRGAESTTAASHSNGANITNILTAGAINSNFPILIGSLVLGSAQATLSFSGIPANWNNLRLYFVGRNSGANNSDNILLQINGDTGANYDYNTIQVAGSSTAFSSHTGQTSINISDAPGTNIGSNYVGSGAIDIIDYAGSFYKTVLLNGWMYSTTTFREMTAGQWQNTAAITSISIFFSTGANWITGSKAFLYALP